MKNISKNVIIAAVVGLVIGFLIGWFAGRGGWASESHNMNDAAVGDTNARNEQFGAESMTDSRNVNSVGGVIDALRAYSSPAEESDSAIMVFDQRAGNTATVASVETDHSVWVVIREDKNGVLGNILGASRVDAGASNNIVVALLRPTVIGQTYQVVLYKDTGDSKFDYRTDVPLTSNGVLISQPFQAIAS